MNKSARCFGFTLIELAISIFIVALLLGSILIPLATQVEQRQIAETQATMNDIREALLGFAVSRGHLPCPDQPSGTPNDGVEDASATGLCLTVAPDGSASGNLPWVTLGLGQQDAWGNHFRYTVLETYARRAPASLFGLGTGGGLRVCSATTCPGTSTLTSTAVAVVISHGKNGLGATNAISNSANPSPTFADEIDNTNNDRDSVSRTQSNVAGAEFDDIVVWLPKFTLNSRMVTAGKIP